MADRAIVFTEGGTRYGYGHIIRSKVLYDEFRKRSMEACFVINSDIELNSILGNCAYITDKWCDKIDQYDLADCYVIIDSYDASEETCSYISQKCKIALFIDDNNRIEYPTGMIVNPGIGGEGADYQKKDGRNYLLGTKYTIIREEFSLSERRSIRPEVENVLITMGGADSYGYIYLLLKFFWDRQYRQINFHIVVGGNSGNTVPAEFNDLTDNFFFYRNQDAVQLSDLMLKCDLAITAAGQTVNELIAMNLPFICFRIIDNQDNNIRGLLSKKIIKDYYDLYGFGMDIEAPLFHWLNKAFQENTAFEMRKRTTEIMSDMDVKNGAKKIIGMMVEKESL